MLTHLAASGYGFSRHDFVVKLDLSPAVDGGHVKHGLALGRHRKLVEPLMPRVWAAEGLAWLGLGSGLELELGG